MLLGIDIGTTNSKVGLFDRQGKTIAIASEQTETKQHPDRFAYYDPESMWQSIARSISRVLEGQDAGQVEGIGITSMAETGVLVDRKTGEATSWMMPWFDTCSEAQAKQIYEKSDPLEMFSRTGLTNSFKLGLAKILWLRERLPQADLERSTWLSASGYIAYRLSGAMGTDYSLAARTYAFRIDQKKWDAEWLKEFDLSVDLFPEATPAGTVIGHVNEAAANATGLKQGVPVVIAGHDHVVAALAVGAIEKGTVFDSMGTAETLVGTMDEQPLGEREWKSGLSFGCHIAPNRYFWMGGNNSSGGSVEWLRTVLSDDTLSYEKLLHLLDQCEPGPTGILYYPYLAGSGAPKRDSSAKAAFIGIDNSHSKKDLIKAVLEGTSYQLAAIRKEAEGIAGHDIHKLLVVGGGTRNPHWLQIKADVLNCSLELPGVSEATLLGAAMTAGWGAGLYKSVEDAVEQVRLGEAKQVLPRAEYSEQYQRLYEEGYDRLQAPLRQFYSSR